VKLSGDGCLSIVGITVSSNGELTYKFYSFDDADYVVLYF